MEDSRVVERSISKKPIVASLIIIVLCLSSIFGLSYALFTSGGEDGKIGINVISGKVRVAIVDENDNSLLGDDLDFLDEDKATEIYFEPGATYVTQKFAIKNIGSVPINYRAYITNDVHEDMERLPDVFDFFIADDPDDIENAVPLDEFEGSLPKDHKSDYYCLVVRMHEDAGNTFQEKKYSGVGITVFAIQGNVSVSEGESN